MNLQNVSQWEGIYDKLLQIEKSFLAKYSETEPQYYEKNCIEFLVEIGEFLNETKCFKFWTIKKPDKNKMLEEFVDCLTMIFLFADNFKITVSDLISSTFVFNQNLIETINDLYIDSANLMHNISVQLIKRIFANLIYIGNTLELTEADIILAFKNKLYTVELRLTSNY